MDKSTALLVIDVQNGMFAADNPVYQGEQLLATIGGLIGRARAQAVPVIYVRHNVGTAKREFDPGLSGG
jgi:aminoglycoside 6'-N-acetyltransferase